MSYTNPLPSGISLQIFNNDQLVYESSGKWLHPLFNFLDFLKTYTGPKDNLSLHDTAVGKAAAVLALRAGVKKINAELLSEIAKNYIEETNTNLTDSEKIQLQWTNLVPKIMCATETQLAELHDSEQMYQLLLERLNNPKKA